MNHPFDSYLFPERRCCSITMPWGDFNLFRTFFSYFFHPGSIRAEALYSSNNIPEKTENRFLSLPSDKFPFKMNLDVRFWIIRHDPSKKYSNYEFFFHCLNLTKYENRLCYS